MLPWLLGASCQPHHYGKRVAAGGTTCHGGAAGLGLLVAAVSIPTPPPQAPRERTAGQSAPGLKQQPASSPTPHKLNLHLLQLCCRGGGGVGTGHGKGVHALLQPWQPGLRSCWGQAGGCGSWPCSPGSCLQQGWRLGGYRLGMRDTGGDRRLWVRSEGHHHSHGTESCE